MVYIIFEDNFFNDIGKIRIKSFAHIGACMFGSRTTGNLHQAIDRNLIPVINISLLFLNQSKLLFRVVDQSC